MRGLLEVGCLVEGWDAFYSVASLLFWFGVSETRNKLARLSLDGLVVRKRGKLLFNDN